MEHYRNTYEDTYNKSTAALLRAEFPKLSAGLVCSALHPLIHIGYGLDVDFDEMVSFINIVFLCKMCFNLLVLAISIGH